MNAVPAPTRPWRSTFIAGTVGRGQAWSGRLELVGLVLLAMVALVAFRRYADDTAGGSDAYGYVSEAQRLSSGQFYVREHVFSQFGLAEDSSLTAPLGYVGKGPDGTIPTYPFGYPLLMSGPVRLFGPAAGYWVAPLLGVATILLTYAAARPHIGRLGGFLAAGLVFFFPNFIWSAVQPMSDVPAAFCAAVMYAILLNPRRRLWTDILLGAALGLGVWIRPNMGLLLVPTIGWLIWSALRPRTSSTPGTSASATVGPPAGATSRDHSFGYAAFRYADWRPLLRFALGLLPFLLIEAAVNNLAYGAPWTTGYGNPPLAHSIPEVGRRAVHYLGWLNEQQIGLGLVLLAAGLVFGRLARPYRVLLATNIAIIWAFFAAYPFDDAWWYGRFLLPIVPAVAILEASALVRLVEVGPFRAARWAALVVAAAVFMVASHQWAGAHSVFLMGDGDRKYSTAAQWARQYVHGPAIVLAMQHSGTLRMYADLPTARYDGDQAKLLDKLQRVQAAGGPVYLLVEGWELDDVRAKRPALLEGATQIGHLDTSGIRLFRLAPLDPTAV
ncbi:MAG: glycosyltransferase family 39 protein [Chloroflexi bacterium]|nr:glycosyltransferase family 39 protein [Chloroflexota bacterium]